MPKELDREVVTHTLNAPHCECCGHELHQCGTEVSEELKIIPQKVSVIRHERAKYAAVSVSTPKHIAKSSRHQNHRV